MTTDARQGCDSAKESAERCVEPCDKPADHPIHDPAEGEHPFRESAKPEEWMRRAAEEILRTQTCGDGYECEACRETVAETIEIIRKHAQKGKQTMLTPKKERYVCNNCAATKAGEKCDDCTMHGCQCPCQSESAKPSKPASQAEEKNYWENELARQQVEYQTGTEQLGGVASKPAEVPPKRFERCPDCGSPFPDFECSGLNHHILTRRAGMIIAECPNRFHAGFPDHFGKTKVIVNAR